MLVISSPAMAQAWGSHEVENLEVSDDDGTTVTCVSATGDRLYHDTDCDDTKDAGEEFIDFFNIVDDTTPQLGADLECQGNNIQNGGVIFLLEQADADVDVVGEGQIWVNTATPNELFFTDDAGTDFQLGQSGAGAFSDASDPIVQNTITKDVHIGDGAGTLTGKLEIGGDADQPQFVVEGHSTQTDSLAVFQNDSDMEQLSISPTGSIFITEKADADADVASHGQIWTNTATPTELFFTDDAGLDTRIDMQVSADLSAILGDETGSGVVVFGTSPTIATPALTLVNSAAPTPTAEGVIEWETDDDHLIVGDGSASVEFVPAEDVSGDCTMTDAGVIECTEADALEANGGNCSAGEAFIAGGVDASGVAEGCDATPAFDGADFTNIPSSAITTELRSIIWLAAAMSSDGTQCADPTEVTLGSGPKLFTIICTDNDASIIDGSVVMPDCYDGGTVTFELTTVNDNATPANDYDIDFSVSCRGNSDVINSTYGTEIAADVDFDASGTCGGSACVTNELAMVTTSAVTGDGTCASGDWLFWKGSLDATGTTATVADVNILANKMEYTCTVGD